MATGATLLLINHPQEDILPPSTSSKARNLRAVLGYMDGWVAGFRGLGSHSVTLVQNGQATGTVTVGAASGTVGATINGVSVTVTYATSASATATALAAAINASANALVNQHVTASASSGVVTLTSKFPGHAGNAVTLAASGTGMTASGARLSGGTNGNGGAQ